MEIVINIEKKHAFIILGGLLLLAIVGIVYAITPDPGHDITDFGPGTIDRDVNITGKITIKGDIIIKGLPENATHKNLIDAICDIEPSLCP
jgi:hypothetical protein